MSDTLRLVSTTDTPEQMQAAMARATGEPVVEAPAGDTPPADGVTPPEGAAAVEPPAGETPPGVDPAVSEAARVLAESKKSKADERKASIQADIDRLSWKKHQLADEAAREEARLAAVRAERERAEQGPAKPAEPVAVPRPKVEDFADYDTFVEALSDWKAEQKVGAVRAEIKAINDAIKARDDKAQQTTEEQQVAEIQRTHTERVVAYAATQPDYHAVMAAATDDPAFNMPPSMYAHMVHSDMGPELAYALAKLPPAEFRALAELPERRMLAALGRLEQRVISSRPAAAPPTGPAAKAPLNLPPPPPKPVSGRSSASTKSPDQMTPAEYSAWRRSTRTA